MLCLELAGPLFDLLFGFSFRHSIMFLDLASQYLDIAFDLLYVVVREFAPLVADATAQLLPVALNPVLKRIVFHLLVPLSFVSYVRATLIIASTSPLAGWSSYVRNFMRSIREEREKKRWQQHKK